MRRLLIAATLTTFALPLAAQSTTSGSSTASAAHPDFTGSWALDPKASDMGMMSMGAMTMHVSLKDSTLKVDRTATGTPMGDQSNSMSFYTTASPAKNSLSANGMTLDMSTVTSWEGPTMVLTTTASANGQTITQTDRWTLDEDGKTLHIASSVSAMGQSMASKMTFNKQ